MTVCSFPQVMHHEPSSEAVHDGADYSSKVRRCLKREEVEEERYQLEFSGLRHEPQNASSLRDVFEGNNGLSVECIVYPCAARVTGCRDVEMSRCRDVMGPSQARREIAAAPRKRVSKSSKHVNGVGSGFSDSTFSL